METLPCRHCGHEVPGNPPRCPYCAHEAPLKPAHGPAQEAKAQAVAWLISMAIAGTVLALFWALAG
jgi:hypothetical protein